MLKDPGQASLRDRYLAGDQAARRRALAQSDQLPLPDPGVFSNQPLAPEIEWFFTPRELSRSFPR